MNGRRKGGGEDVGKDAWRNEHIRDAEAVGEEDQIEGMKRGIEGG